MIGKNIFEFRKKEIYRLLNWLKEQISQNLI